MLKYLRNISLLYYLYCYLAGLLNSFRFRHIHSLLLFLGYPRSGSSTLGSLLDAHKNIIVAHELNILKYIQKGYKTHQLFFLLARNSKLFTSKGRISSGYKGLVAGQFNGKAAPCLVIGDKQAGITSMMLEKNPELKTKLLKTFPVIKVIHIVRNPFDMIATRAYKGNDKQSEVTEKKISEAIEVCARKFKTIGRLIKHGTLDIYTIKHEILLQNPDIVLTSLLSWLNVGANEGYIDACKAFLFDTPHRSRHKIFWTGEQIDLVNKLISTYDFLEGYSFEN